MSPEEKAERQLDHLDVMADAWAEEVNLAMMIENMTSPFDLSRAAPADVVKQFRSRMKEQINAIALQCFVEGAVRGIDMIQGLKRPGMN
jgi:hypothetical protein